MVVALVGGVSGKGWEKEVEESAWMVAVEEAEEGEGTDVGGKDVGVGAWPEEVVEDWERD